MAKLLSEERCRREILARLERVRPDSPRRWGKMTAPQMICHLRDSFLGVMGEKPMEIPPPARGYRLVKWFALHTPMRWPPGVKTRPEFDQLAGGTPPTQFDADVQSLCAAIDCFVAQPRSLPFRPHPIFLELTEEEWMRWGYRHMDHHLRQFGR